MMESTICFYDKTNKTDLLAQCNSRAMHPDKKGSYANNLIASLLITEECHENQNRPYKLPKDFCYIYYACLNLKKKSNINSKTGELIDKRKIPDGPYEKVHRFFLHCKQGNWDEISFFDISDTLAILSANDIFPKDLKQHLQEMRELLIALDNLEYRYPHLLPGIFPSNSDISSFKKNILLSLCCSDKKQFLRTNEIYTIRNKIYELQDNPYKPQKK